MKQTTIRSDKLLGLTTECPDCGRTIHSTDTLVYERVFKDWLIRFWCDFDGNPVDRWREEWKPLIDEVLRESQNGQAVVEAE